MPSTYIKFVIFENKKKKQQPTTATKTKTKPNCV